jgi:hypothetical protein
LPVTNTVTVLVELAVIAYKASVGLKGIRLFRVVFTPICTPPVAPEEVTFAPPRNTVAPDPFVTRT